ncbi:AAA family ATPase [Endozoicomonas acroporae]|uniref:AAA family ATPase n=1 Tax=Endozoicomonas acroporae TaxID=1701104 RepID=UPI000C76863A|nr:ATP/GTP-binding protein [Endozoicomonas acroporae]
MLLRFSVENYRSFRDRVELSMVPSRVRTHSGHVIPPGNPKDIGALKAAVIYGANASGKSNLIKAMHFARLMIVQGSPQGKNLNYDPFLLDKDCSQKPSRFEFEIKCGKNNYAYGFMADSKFIQEEWLYKIDKKGESPVFVRTSEHSISFPALKFKSKDDEQFLSFTAKATPGHRLFLFECQDRNVTKALDYIKPLTEVNDWFHHRLNIVFPDSKYNGLEMAVHSDDTVSSLLASILRSFDTGINDLSLKQVDLIKDVYDIPDHIKQDIMATLEAGEASLVSTPDSTRYQILKNQNGEISTFKLMTSHKNHQGESVDFDINQESDGSQRILDIAPGLLELFSQDKVYVIDEIDRSLHSEITMAILSQFLSLTTGRHSQLIVTTHESNLLDVSLIRRDEIWFAQKSSAGVSSLYSLEEYQSRPDKDIRKDYLVGRFGGVPVIKDGLNNLVKGINND